MKSRSLILRKKHCPNTVRFNNRLNDRPVAVLQTKLTNVTSLLDSGSQNSTDSSQQCIDTGLWKSKFHRIEKLKASDSLISSDFILTSSAQIQVVESCKGRTHVALSASDKRWMCSWADLIAHLSQSASPFLSVASSHTNPSSSPSPAPTLTASSCFNLLNSSCYFQLSAVYFELMPRREEFDHYSQKRVSRWRKNLISVQAL